MRAGSVIAIGEALIDRLGPLGGDPSSDLPITDCFGGAPANVACALSRLGAKVSFIGSLGNDAFGEDFNNLLIQRGINTSGLQQDTLRPTRVVLVRRDPDGERCFEGFEGDKGLGFADQAISLEHIIRDWPLVVENAQSLLMRFLRPVIKTFVRQRLLSSNIFNIAAKPKFITKILKVAYPSGNNVDEELIDTLFKPTQSTGAPEAFRGFINLFDDYLAPNLLKEMNTSVHLIWGEKDPWEPVKEAQKWFKTFECIKSLDVISDAGHCPHDEMPEKVNPILIKIIQEAI